MELYLRIPQEQHALNTLVLGNLKPITRPQPTFDVKDTQIHCLSNIYCLVFMTDSQHLVIILRFPCLKVEFVLDTVKMERHNGQDHKKDHTDGIVFNDNDGDDNIGWIC